MDNTRGSKRKQFCWNCFISLKNELHPRNLLLHNDDPSLFVKTQCGPSVLFLVWSGCWAVLHALVLLLQPYFQRDYEDSVKWFSYLTYWGYTTLGIFTIWDFATSLFVHIRRRDILNRESDVMTWYLKVLWVQYNFNTPIALLITILYYSYIPNDTGENSILTHGMNTAYVSANIIVSAKPMRTMHVLHPVLYGCIYLVFSLAYQKCTGNVVYIQLDWENQPRTTYFMLAILLLLLPCLFVVCVIITRLRTWISVKLSYKHKIHVKTDGSEISSNIIL